MKVSAMFLTAVAISCCLQMLFGAGTGKDKALGEQPSIVVMNERGGRKRSHTLVLRIDKDIHRPNVVSLDVEAQNLEVVAGKDVWAPVDLGEIRGLNRALTSPHGLEPDRDSPQFKFYFLPIVMNRPGVYRFSFDVFFDDGSLCRSHWIVIREKEK